MGEKAKNVIMDVLKSEEMRGYFKELLSSQTKEIVKTIQQSEHVQLREELQKNKEEVDRVKEKNGDLEVKVRELEISSEHYKKLYDNKLTECEDAVQQKKELEQQISLSIAQNEQLKHEITKLNQLYEEQIQKEKEERENFSNRLSEYEDKFRIVNIAFSNYQRLPGNVKQRIGNIFGEGNIYSFIVAVCDWNNIEGIWSFTKRRIIEDELDGLNELVNLFTLSFEIFCLSDGSGKYELIKPMVGERFDSDKQSIKGIKTDGQIEEVLLAGVYDTITKKAVFKAVVQIR